MSDDFKSGDKVVCISDRTPCCKRKFPSLFGPTVGEVYTVADIGLRDTECLDNMPVFHPKDLKPERTWPQACFKKLPPPAKSKLSLRKEQKQDSKAPVLEPSQ